MYVGRLPMIDSVDIVIDAEYKGPSILELESSISNITADLVEVRWTNTKPEFYIFQKFKGKKKFRLYVADLTAQERAASFLGQSLQLDQNILESGKANLNATGWRDYATGLGTAVCRSVVTKIAADAVRKGKPGKMVSVAKDCVLDNISPLDADVLLRLRIQRSLLKG